MAAHSLNILIIGGGLGGPAAALLLARAGHKVTIVERYPALRAGGTQIDLRHQGVEVANHMGIMADVREKMVHEAGISLVDRNNKVKVYWPGGEGAHADMDGFPTTQEVEIMRGDLVRILYDATKDNVTYIFGTSVESYEQDESSVNVTFSDKTKAVFDLLIGADGLGSWTRRSMLPPGSKDSIKSLHTWLAYWFIPRGPTDTNVARAYQIPGRKLAMLRRAPGSRTQAYLASKTDSPEMRSITRVSEAQQKAVWAEMFKGLGWETDRMISSLQTTDDFYCTEIAQVHAPAWSKGRVVLCGDAAHCPSPMTGMGTTSAFVGAYVLAGEIATHSRDLKTAFENYEKVLRPWMTLVQKLPPSPVMDVFHPETSWGITFAQILIRAIYWVAVVGDWLRLWKLWEWMVPDKKRSWKLPAYPILMKKQ